MRGHHMIRMRNWKKPVHCSRRLSSHRTNQFQGDCWFISAVTALLFSDLPLVGYKKGGGEANHDYELLRFLARTYYIYFQGGLKGCPLLPSGFQWSPQNYPRDIFAHGHPPVIFLNHLITYSRYYSLHDFKRDIQDIFNNAIEHKKAVDENTMEAISYELMADKRRIYILKFINNMKSRHVYNVIQQLYYYVRFGFLVCTFPLTGEKHAIAIAKCEGNLWYCNSWGKPCNELSKLKRDKNLPPFSTVQIYLYLSAAPPRSIEQQRMLDVMMNKGQQISQLMLERGKKHMGKIAAGLKPFTHYKSFSQTELTKQMFNKDGENADGGKFNALTVAIYHKNVEFLKYVMNGRIVGGRVSAMINDHLMLHFACKWGDDRIVQLLIEKGADVSLLNGSGLTTLHSAALGASDDTAKRIMMLLYNEMALIYPPAVVLEWLTKKTYTQQRTALYYADQSHKKATPHYLKSQIETMEVASALWKLKSK